MVKVLLPSKLVVLESNKLQYLQPQGPMNGDLLLKVHKLSTHLECHVCHVTLCGLNGPWSEMAFDLSEPAFDLRSRHFGFVR